MFRLTFVELEHSFKEAASLFHWEPSIALYVKSIEKLFNVLQTLWNIFLLQSFNAVFVVVEYYSKKHTRQEEYTHENEDYKKESIGSVGCSGS